MIERIKNAGGRVKNTVDWVKSWELETLKSLRTTFFFIIVIDLFGVYWYWGLESLGTAIMVFCIVGLSLVLLLEKFKYDSMPIESKGGTKQMEEETAQEVIDKSDKPKKAEKKEESGFGLDMDLGLPNSEDYNKRMEDALGSGF